MVTSLPPTPSPVDVDLQKILRELRQRANPADLAGMARFGIQTGHALGGTSMPALRQMAKGRRSHALALALWDTGLHEARILASLVDLPGEVSLPQAERWVQDFNSWDLCDQVCSNLFWRTSFAWEKALEWSTRPEEYVKRAGFVLMVELAVHAKTVEDERFLPFLEAARREAGDERNFVKKAVNWALRGIGKRSPGLQQAAISTCLSIQTMPSRASRWVASDALRELTTTQKRSRKEAHNK